MELSAAFKDVEKAHEDLCLLLDENDLDEEDSYLDSPSEILSNMHVTVNKAITTARNTAAALNATTEKERQFKGSLAAFKSSIESFGNPSLNLTHLSTEKN